MEMNIASMMIGLTAAPAATACLRQWFISSSNASLSGLNGSAFINPFHPSISFSSFMRYEGTVLPKTDTSLEALALAQNTFKRSVKTWGEGGAYSFVRFFTLKCWENHERSRSVRAFSGSRSANSFKEAG